MKFKTIPQSVEADQYETGKQIPGVLGSDEFTQAMVQGAIERGQLNGGPNAHITAVMSRKDNKLATVKTVTGWKLVNPGEWVVTKSDKTQDVVSNDEFGKLYEKAE